MSFLHKNRGAVSVFLILVLVPCIVISSIFVDLSRVHLSKATAESAADLALNTLMTNYDKELSEYYGLIGSCQNLEEFYKVSADFFLRTLKSQDLAADEILLLAGVYADATSDDTIFDLLEVECDNATVGPVANANLGQPAFLKDSIVEFMKYRAPIEMAATLIGRIKSGAGGVTEFLEAEDNEPLVDAKEDFFETEGELLKAAIYSYLAIKDYDTKFRTPSKYSVEKMKLEAEALAKYKEVYKQLHEIAVNNLLNTGGLSKYQRPTYDIWGYYNKYTGESVRNICSRVEEEEDEEGEETTVTYYISGHDFSIMMEAASRSLSELEAAVGEYSNATGDLMNSNPLKNSNISDVQWWVDMHRAVHNGPYGNVHSKIVSKGNAVMESFAKLWAIYQECEADPNTGMPSDWKSQCENRYDELYAAWDKYLSGHPTTAGHGGYVDAAIALTTVSAQNHPRINSSYTGQGSTVVVDGSTMSVNNAIIAISNQLINRYKAYDALIKLLNIAIDGNEADGGKVKSLDKLLELAKTYNTNFNKYSQEANKANNAGTTLGEQEKKQVDEMQLQKEINEEAVRELKTRLVNIRDQFSTLKVMIETTTYGGKSLKDIRDFNTFKNCALTVVQDGSIPLNQTGIDSYSDQTLPQLLKPAAENEIKLENTDNNDYNPDLDVQTPALWAYMKEEFKDVKIDELEKVEEEQEKTEDEQKKFEEEEKTKATEYRGNKGATMSNTYGWSETFGATDLLGSLIDFVGDIIDGNFAGIRDDMYVTTYAMEMFSHAAYDREAMYHKLTADQRAKMAPGTADAYFKECKLYGEKAEDRGTWLSTDVRDSYNKTLTNKMINNANNHINLAEIEYLLYGQSSPQENLKKSYGNIYGIRLILNTISGYQHFWGTSNTTGIMLNTVAVSLSGATAGIVPPAVFMVVMIPILAALESCKDMSRLFAGMPVELYKIEANDWWVSLEMSGKPSGLSDFLTKLKSAFISDEGKNQDDGFFYSDYLTMFVYCSLTNSKTEADTYKRLAELIDANMAKVRPKKGGEAGFTLMKTQMYFQLTATVRVKPLMITIPYMDEYGNSMETATDWCTYQVSMVRGYS